jgi:hypothetical protein
MPQNPPLLATDFLLQRTNFALYKSTANRSQQDRAMPLTMRANQVQAIKSGVKDMQNWSTLIDKFGKDFAAAKAALKTAPKDAAAIKAYERTGERLLNAMDARNQHEAALIRSRKFFRIYD